MAEEFAIKQEDLGNLSDSEVELIHIIRTKYRWGKILIEVANGRPTFLEQTVVREKLG